MKKSLRLFSIYGISVEAHISFGLLPLLFALLYGLKGIFLVLFVFSCVLLHELMHSLKAKQFNTRVDKIVLFPIGGVAYMGRQPLYSPREEFITSIAGPLFNFIVAALLFFPLYHFLGKNILFSPSLSDWQRTFAYCFWTNIMLGTFNLLPAFPMDGGRILRACLSKKLGFIRATKIAVRLGHIFAILFALIGLFQSPPNFILILIAFFIYLSASNEETMIRGGEK